MYKTVFTKQSVVTCILFAFIIQLGGIKGTCPEGWESWVVNTTVQGCYMFVQQNITRENAFNECRTQDNRAHLVVITSQEENSYVTELIKTYQGSDYWLGLFCPDGACTNCTYGQHCHGWLWQGNMSVPLNEIQYWLPGEPQGKEWCATITPSGEWKGTPCNNTYYFICELDIEEIFTEVSTIHWSTATPSWATLHCEPAGTGVLITWNSSLPVQYLHLQKENQDKNMLNCDNASKTDGHVLTCLVSTEHCTYAEINNTRVCQINVKSDNPLNEVLSATCATKIHSFFNDTTFFIVIGCGISALISLLVIGVTCFYKRTRRQGNSTFSSVPSMEVLREADGELGRRKMNQIKVEETKEEVSSRAEEQQENNHIVGGHVDPVYANTAVSQSNPPLQGSEPPIPQGHVTNHHQQGSNQADIEQQIYVNNYPDRDPDVVEAGGIYVGCDADEDSKRDSYMYIPTGVQPGMFHSAQPPLGISPTSPGYVDVTRHIPGFSSLTRTMHGVTEARNIPTPGEDTADAEAATDDVYLGII